MKQTLFTITDNRALTGGVMELRAHGDTAAITAPGQFVNIRLTGKFLRRPISVCNVAGDELTLIYKIVGGGTRQLAAMQPGQTLDLLTGLGNGYDLAPAGDSPVLLGGGVGTPPMFWLARELLARGKHVHAVLGFNSAEDVFYEEELRSLGADVTVTTVDGSRGVKGFVTDGLPQGYSYFYACGPEPMLRAVFRATKTSGQLSFEERMGCGFGACMGCSCKTLTGYKRICKDGPVLRKEEIAWER